VSQYTNARLLTDGDGNPIPQYLDVNDKTDSPQGTFKPLTGDPRQVQLTGSNVALDVNVVNTNNDWKLQEQLTQADAVNGTLTFSDVVKVVDIFNQDPTNSGVFTINGLSITVPANTFFCAEIGGNLSNTVTVSGTTSYIIGRYA